MRGDSLYATLRAADLAKAFGPLTTMDTRNELSYRESEPPLWLRDTGSILLRGWRKIVAGVPMRVQHRLTAPISQISARPAPNQQDRLHRLPR